MTRHRIGTFVWCGGIRLPLVILVATIFLVSWATTSDETRLLESDGVDTVATVVSKRVDSSSVGGDSTIRKRSHYITVEFLGPLDTTLTQTRRIEESTYGKVNEGDEIAVRYVRQDPTIIEIEPGRRIGSASWAGWAGLGLSVLSFGMIWHCWRKSGQGYRAAHIGAAGDTSSSAPKNVLARRLADKRLTLRKTPSNEDAEEVMILELAATGHGVMPNDTMKLTFDWSVSGEDLFCIRNMRMGGIALDDAAPGCARVQISGDRITLDWSKIMPNGWRSARGTISPL